MELLAYHVRSYTWKALIGQNGQKKTVDVVIVVVSLLEMQAIRSPPMLSSQEGFESIAIFFMFH